MIRSTATALVGTALLATLAGCAYQDPFGLPELTPRGSSPTVQVHPYYGSGYGYGYPYGYRPGYGYGYASPNYAAQGPYPYAYGYGYGYNPYPRYVVVPCADGNRDGHCDSRPSKDHEHQGGDHDGDHHRDDQPVRQRDVRGVVPAPVVQQPARVRPESRHAIPPDATTPRSPRAGKGHQPMTGDDVAQSRPTQEP